jgi:hypothetical protein
LQRVGSPLRTRFFFSLSFGHPPDAEPTRSDITHPAIMLPSVNEEMVTARTGDPCRLCAYDLVYKALKDQHARSDDPLDAPNNPDHRAVVGQPVSNEEIDVRLARLSLQERETLMMVTAKMSGRWVELRGCDPQTRTTTMQSNGA